MSHFKPDKKNEEDSGGNLFSNLDKTIVLQETRAFGETPVNHRKCAHILTKILYLTNQGEKWTTQEATDAFFATTKLFQSKDVLLRRLMYLCIKDLSTIAQDVIIVTSSLTKDMTGKEDMYRASAIRALCSITDPTMLQAIERYMKQAIVDKNPSVSSAALVSALHLSNTAPDLMRRWANEAQEAINSDNPMVSYHALGVVAATRKNDKLSTAKLVSRFTRAPMKSPFAVCLLIRLAAQLAKDDDSNSQYLDFIEACLRHKSEMVVYEAAQAIINLRQNPKDLAPAVSILQIFCGSSKPALRLAGAKSLAMLTAKHPNAVSACAVDLENLISDSNRSVATLAVTTLLATGAESSIDRLLKQISTFMSEISDEFKIVVVRAVRKLCTKYPRKHQVLASFLAGMLRDEGGFEFKAAIADAIIALVEENPDAKDIGLAHLCEFIEDCEHTNLAVRILHLLGREGPTSRHPSRYIRFIYNRVILESGPVRAAAVSAVARFGALNAELLPNIMVLLDRCQMDDDDEVRDRAIFYSLILESGDSKWINEFIVNVQVPNFALLEKALKDAKDDEWFDIDTVPTEEKKEESKEVVEMEPKLQQVSKEEQAMDVLATVPGVDKMGPLFKTSDPVDLTEPETEYQVRCIKHVFTNHLVLQFECQNTLSDQLLENVRVNLETPGEYKILAEIPCASLPFNKTASCFAILQFPPSVADSLGTFAATLEFTVKDCDPTTGVPDAHDGYTDNYPLEEFEIGCPEQLRAKPGSDWEGFYDQPELSDTFGLPQTDIGEACSTVCEYLGLPKTCISGNAVKEIRGGGIFRGGIAVHVKARLAMTGAGVTMEIASRSPKEEIAQFILTTIG